MDGVAKLGRLLLNEAAAYCKPSEIDSKETILRVHLITAFGRTPVARIDEDAIANYAARKALTHARKSVNNQLSVLRQLLAIARRRKLIAAIPEIRWLEVPEPEFDFLSFEDARRLIAGAAEKWRALIKLAARTGLRFGELVALRWCDVDWNNHQLVVRRSATRGLVTTPKSGKKRLVPLCREALGALERQRHARGELVFCHDDGRMLTYSACRKPLWRACDAAGVRRISWHVLRHTFASHMVMLDVAMKKLKELLGHSTLAMTERYAHLAPSALHEAVAKLDSVAV